MCTRYTICDVNDSTVAKLVVKREGLAVIVGCFIRGKHYH